ncbi:MAG: two-component sensor histidine kinase [Desulfobulbaceae bacterium]|uniref:histidine kinase n=1 Tax=Candidatus Desulfobia pelagia TaxID=2841692 RepID=A0A8J6NDB5_9BACT|nr:two-component sensor histidine kinase [Candidatus Desulfobia pelagia]
MSITPSQFDRQFQLQDLLSAADQERIASSLSLLLDRQVTLSGPEVPPPAGAVRSALQWELETIGHVDIVGGDEVQLKACVNLIVLLIKSAARFQMASDLHIETVHADYEALQQKHAALQESENRYKNLAEQLEQKVAEQVKTIQDAQSKLYQTAKLASVGQLAAGVAHEINTPLAYIQSNLDSALTYLEDLTVLVDLVHKGAEQTVLQKAWEEQEIDYIMDDFPQLLQDNLDGVKKVAAIVADLKIFSNIDKSEQILDDINTRLKTVVKMILHQLPEYVDIKLDLQEIPSLTCHPGHLGQAFYNLILNGSQAIAGKGTIRIATACDTKEIRIVIQDTGAGIAEADLPRIFDPFFTTREVGSGTGLGLTVINNIIKAHGGRIEVQSQVGKGSTFTVFLPLNPLE